MQAAYPIGKLLSPRDELGRAMEALGDAFPAMVVLTADVAKSTGARLFGSRYPQRYFHLGICEANMMGIAAGMATCRLLPVTMAYAVFAAEKPYEQIRNCIAYPALNVKIVATHGGINVGEDGATHQAIEDIAIMRALPNMTVLAVSDPADIGPVLCAALRHVGPVYVRLARMPQHTLSTGEYEITIGRARLLREGADVTLLAVGIMVEASLIAASLLAQMGVSARVVNLVSVKPLDAAAIVAAARETGALVVAEDHSRMGGAGGAVAEVLAARSPVPMEQVALDDCFAESGPAEALLTKYGLSPEAIVEAALKAIARKKGC